MLRIEAIDSGVKPWAAIQGFAKRTGEYQMAPIAKLASAATTTARMWTRKGDGA